jgi:hypothetical protein
MTGIGRTSGGRHVYSADANFQNRISAQFAFDPIENLNRFRSFVRSNGTIYGDYSPDNTAIEGVKNKTSQSYKLNKASQTLNGNSVGVTGEPSLLPSPSIFEIGKYMGSYDYLNGYVSQITYYPTAVTDTVLINLTK